MEDTLFQLEILYRRTIEVYPYMTREFRSLSHLLEDMFAGANVYEANEFRVFWLVDAPKDLPDRLLPIIQALRAREPFSSVVGRSGSMLNALNSAIGDNNLDLALATLRQLARSIESLEEGLQNENRRNRLSVSVLIIGIILSIVFGFISILQFWLALPVKSG